MPVSSSSDRVSVRVSLPIIVQCSVGAIATSFLSFIAVPANGQIVPDATLGSESSIITPAQLQGWDGDRIDGGAIRGSALFHSFLEFNVNGGRAAYFANPAGIEAILSRVTGNNPSNIFGRLGVLGHADLFLLNPNGIVFGPGASLDVAGSFMATTADAFTFVDGQVFSAISPEAPPLLTVNVNPGLQIGAGANATIANYGMLVTGKDLHLAAVNLDLRGWIQSGGDLILQGLETVTIRDSITEPFVAAAGQNLVVQGNQGVDIFALNHPDSGLFAVGDLTLRSGVTVIGDAHYWSGGNFSIEQLDGTLLDWNSPNDPVIQAIGDVTFDSYTGESLHVLAGGSVTVPGIIEITGAAPTGGLIETITLSDGSTVNINGQNIPTVDIRAGTLAVSLPGVFGDTTGFVEGIPSLGPTPTSADISIGSIRNPGGTVFLTNQYQPDLTLAGGDIQVGAIDTSITSTLLIATGRETELQVQGGNITLDARGGIDLTGDVDTSASASVGSDDINTPPLDNPIVGDGLSEATAGAIRLLAEGAVTTQALTATATANTSVLSDANRDAIATATGGDIEITTQASITTGDINTTANATANANTQGTYNYFSYYYYSYLDGGNINTVEATANGGTVSFNSQSSLITGDINTTANATANGSANGYLRTSSYYYYPSYSYAYGGDIGTVTATANGGEISVDTRSSIVTGNIDTTATATTRASAYSYYFSYDSSSGGNISAVEATARGGEVRLNAQSSITTETIDTFASAFSRVETSSAGDIGTVTTTARGGEVSVNAQASITTGDISTTYSYYSSDDPSAITVVNSTANIDTVITTSTAGQVSLEAQSSIVTGDINATSGASVGLGDGVNIDSATTTSTGGQVSLEAQSSITTGDINTTASISPVTTGVAIVGTIGTLTTTSTGGQVNLAAQSSIVTGDIATFAETSVGRVSSLDTVTTTSAGGQVSLEAQSSIATGNIDTSSSYETFTDVFDDDFGGGDIGTIITTGSGGGIAFNAQSTITAGTIDTSASSNIGVGRSNSVATITQGGAVAANTQSSITFGNIETSGNTSLDVDQGGIDILDSTTNGGGVSLAAETDITTGNIDTTATIDGDISTATTLDLITSGGAIALSSESGVVAPLDGSSLRSYVLGSEGDSGDIQLSGASVQLTNNLLTTSTTDGLGEAGNITIDATGSVEISGSRLLIERSRYLDEQGTGSRIAINGGLINLTGFSLLHTATFGNDNAGDIELTTTQGDIVLQNSNIFSLTGGGEGNAGAIVIDAAGALRLSGNSAINTTVALDTLGRGGDIQIETQDGVFISDPGLTGDSPVVGTQPQLEEIEPNDDTANVIEEELPSEDAVPLEIVNAQSIDAAFSLTDDPEIPLGADVPVVAIAATGEDSTFDYYSFTVNTPGTIVAFELFSSDTADISTVLRLFNDQGTELAFNDGPPATLIGTIDPNSNNEFFPYIFNQPGTYFIRVGEEGFDDDDPLANVASYNLNVYRFDDLIQSGSIATQTQSTGRGGDITMAAPIVRIQGVGQVLAETTGSGAAGDIVLNTERLTLQDGASVSTVTSSEGRSGDITIGATEQIQLTNSTILTESNNTSLSANPGDAGRIQITTPQLDLFNQSTLSTSTLSSGSAGIQLHGLEQLTVQGDSQILATTRTGTAGNLLINAAEGDNPANTILVRGDGSRLATEATRNAGSAGRVHINVRDLTVRNGAEIVTTNRSGSNGGLVLTNVDRLAVLSGGQIIASTKTGITGDIVVNSEDNPANTILIGGEDSRLAVEATGSGTRNTTATTSSGLSRSTGSFSPITTRARNNQGDAGSLSLYTRNLTVSDGGAITVSSDQGSAGNLNITANAVLLDNGMLSTAMARNRGDGEDGANIILRLGEYTLFPSSVHLENSLILRNESLIQANARNGTQGGNITITGADGSIIGFEPTGPDGNDIVARSGLDNGGQVAIAGLELNGIEVRPTRTRLNDIVSNSEPRPPEPETPEPIQELVFPIVETPELEAPDIVFNACNPRSIFHVVGSGGLPSLAHDFRVVQAYSLPWLSRATEPDLPSASPEALSLSTQFITEAEHWRTNQDGSVSLFVSLFSLDEPAQPSSLPAIQCWNFAHD